MGDTYTDISKLIFLALTHRREMSPQDLLLHIPEIGRKKTDRGYKDLIAYGEILQQKGWISICGEGRGKKFRLKDGVTFIPGTEIAFCFKDGSFPIHFGKIYPYKSAKAIVTGFSRALKLRDVA